MTKPTLTLLPPQNEPLISDRQKALLAKLADPEVWKQARLEREAEEQARYEAMLARVKAEKAKKPE